MTPFKEDPIGICVHHSLTADGKMLSSLEAIRRHHIEVNGWDEIGYHAIIEYVKGKARILTGRSTLYQGAHERMLNATHLGVCVVGNFDLEAPPVEVVDALIRYCKGVFSWYPHMDYSHVTFHDIYSEKTCPGELFPRGGFLLNLAGERRPA